MPSLKLFPRFAALALSAFALVARAQTTTPKFYEWAKTPPMGWNSWDAYGSSVKEEAVLANADYMEKNLKSHGWNLITIDIQWYEPTAQRDQYRRGAELTMDANGRLLPAPNRFPMTAASKSWKPMADYLHAKGLKFGLHLMRGVPRQAVRDKTLILGTESLKPGGIHADEIIFPNGANSCGWNTDMNGVDMSKPGAQEYYDSVFALYASMGLDFIKVDDLAGYPKEIEAIRKAIDKSNHPIVTSVSMGSNPNRGEHLASNMNMWRISFDFWDRWSALYNQFENMNGHQPYQGPGHWPDADMLPFGHVKTWETPAHYSNFTHDEQYTVMTLWSIGRSPLIMGGNMPENDEFTLNLMTNDEVIAVNQNSTNNKQLFRNGNHVAWVADVPGSKDKYVALFNADPAPPPGSGRRGGGRRGGAATAPATAPAPVAVDPATTNPALLQPANISVTLADIGITGPAKVRDLWAKKDLGTMSGKITATVNSHGTVIYRVSPQN